MGYELTRFTGEVDEELMCPICSGVLEEPLQASCEHAFCKDCIQKWLTHQPTCPVDRTSITISDLNMVPRILRNLLSRLQISCDNSTYGCNVVVKLDRLASHKEECSFNPKRPTPCEQCGLIIPNDELKEHSCIKELRSYCESEAQKIVDLEKLVNDLRSELNQLKEYFRFRNSLPSSPIQSEHDELIRWSNTLVRARVTRWGGMISTPDNVLQSLVRRALAESGCPTRTIGELMENAHERKWPLGLNSLETRQTNRRFYESFVCKRIPGKQAVVVLACDNPHMHQDMLLEPGLIMIFAHGIE